MEVQMNHLALYERRPPSRNRDTSVRWVKEWVPQDLVSTGGKCLVLRWVREDVLKALKERCNEQEAEEPEPEPTTEVLFLCSFEGCGKTFIDAGALRKHAHIHGERQYVCHYEGCGKKFLDSSKLKRHFLIHTGQRDYVCPHEGCGKAFSLDFNLRAHMRTHTQENYHICPFEDCGKRYAHDYKLQAHIKSHHEKITTMNMRHTPPAEKLQNTPKTPASIYGSASSDRPHACPYEGCGKAYIHEYKLNLHLKREHPGHNPEENGKRASAPFIEHDMNETPEQDAYIGKDAVYKTYKKSKTTLVTKVPPSKVARKGQTLPSANPSFGKKQWPSKEMYDEEDSEETEEDREEDGWRYQETNEDDEETEDED